MSSVMCLFLDFDGVTHPEPCVAERLFCSLPLIESVLRQQLMVEIVVSSSWREFHPLDELRGLFSADIRRRVVGVTPSIKRPSADWLPSATPRHEREWEVESWMKANRPWGTPWLAVDDRPNWFRPDCPNLLVTDRQSGFTAQDADLLVQMILERI